MMFKIGDEETWDNYIRHDIFLQLASKYGGSRVLILGGGDGGLLKELLDHFTSIDKCV